MTSRTGSGWARLTLAAGFSVAMMLAAAAQSPPAGDEVDAEEPAEAATTPDANDADIMKDIDVSKLDWSQLDLDANPLTGPAPKGRTAPKDRASADAAWSANEKPGGTAVSVK